MKEELQQKVRQYFSAMSIYKDPKATNSIFAGRNLPSFVPQIRNYAPNMIQKRK